MNFNELVENVISLTKRPDLLERTQSAVSAATIKAHTRDFFYRDMYEVPIKFTYIDHIQNFNPQEIIPRFRKEKYLRIWNGDAVNGRAGMFLENIHVETALDGYGATKTNVWYRAGQNLQIRVDCGVEKILFGCYLHPKVSPVDQYSSWIAAEYPWYIVYEAAAAIFRSIRSDAQVQQYLIMAEAEFQIIQLSNVDDVPFT